MNPQAGMTSTVSGVSETLDICHDIKYFLAATTTECYDCTTTSKL